MPATCPFNHNDIRAYISNNLQLAKKLNECKKREKEKTREILRLKKELTQLSLQLRQQQDQQKLKIQKLNEVFTRGTQTIQTPHSPPMKKDGSDSDKENIDPRRKQTPRSSHKKTQDLCNFRNNEKTLQKKETIKMSPSIKLLYNNNAQTNRNDEENIQATPIASGDASAALDDCPDKSSSIEERKTPASVLPTPSPASVIRHRRSRRRSVNPIQSYAEPSLNSKLRRGDRYSFTLDK